jgi:hypothetical protein
LGADGDDDDGVDEERRAYRDFARVVVGDLSRRRQKGSCSGRLRRAFRLILMVMVVVLYRGSVMRWNVRCEIGEMWMMRGGVVMSQLVKVNCWNPESLIVAVS